MMIRMLTALAATTLSVTAHGTFRPPAVPLVACDPYFSIWSQATRLTDSDTTHWTGKQHRLTAMLRVDGQTFRLMGASPHAVPAMDQTAVEVLPTRTIYTFAGAGLETTLTFTTPALPGDIALLSRPITYIGCSTKSTDGSDHAVEFFLSASGEIASNLPEQLVEGATEPFEKGTSLKIGTTSQNVLGKSGDDIRIDWGYFYLAAAEDERSALTFGQPEELHASFAEAGTVPVRAAVADTKAADIAAAAVIHLGKVSGDPVSGYLVLAYDDLYSIEYMRSRLRPYWRKDGWDAGDLLSASVAEYDSLTERCAAFDSELMADLEQLGGKEYAQISALAFRQAFAAGKFAADANGQPLQFSKENHSNGCIATSDVFYPMMPQFLLFGPTVTKSVLAPFMEYAASERWTFPFAPHDLGTYPKANGQRYGGGETSEENQMPVEESGNLLLLFGALAKMEGNADYAALYWPQLSQWANYLQKEGFDPANQLCTDDFAGHMAHNVNLSAKAICGLGAYAQLCKARGLDDEAKRYDGIAKRYAKKWIDAAADGDHYRLAFDRPDTWSQKYNLVWDTILGMGLFPDTVLETEMAFYRKSQNAFGLPLDNRSDYTKLDWILWTACLTGKRDDFDALVKPVHRFLDESGERSPMTDWYFTSTAKKVGFTARPVVGGVFLRTLYDDAVWKKYATRDITKASGWAKMPVAPKTVTLVPTSEDGGVIWSYTTTKPQGEWASVAYDASKWNTGEGGFGRKGDPSTEARTNWDSSDIWLRRSFEIEGDAPARIALRIFHDEDAEIYLNGKKVIALGGYVTGYELFEISSDALIKGKNILAIHCHQSTGGQYIDAGFDAIEATQPSK